MKVIFNTVKFRNFMASGNHFIEIDLNKSSRTLLYGSNGAGKSTISEAITFALFGKSLRGINKPSLVNTINDGHCIVEITFKIGTNNYRVIRGIKPSIFEIYINNVLKDQDSRIKDYQDILEKDILKFNFKSFKQIVILGSKNFIPFMKLTAADRRTIIEDILDIQIFSQMARRAKDRLSIIEADISENKRQIKVVNEKITLQKSNIETNTQRNKNKIQQNKKEIETGCNNILTYDTNIENYQYLLSQLETQCSLELKQILNERYKQFSKIETQLEQNNIRIVREIEFFANNVVCPSCKQEIGEDLKEIYVTENKCKHTKILDGQHKLKGQLEEINTKLAKLENSQNEVQKMKRAIELEQTKVKQTLEWQKKLKKEIKDLVTIVFDEENSNVVLNQFIIELAELKKTATILNDTKKYLDVAISLLKDSGVKTNIIKQYLPIINKYINTYLSQMDFHVNFTLDENFDESIMSRHRDSFAYENFSDGEKLRIDLALIFAWRAVAKLKNSVDTNILILDEIIDSALDFGGIDDFFKLIYTFKDTNIFVISPKGETFIDKFPEAIKFEKVQNFSAMEINNG